MSYAGDHHHPTHVTPNSTTSQVPPPLSSISSNQNNPQFPRPNPTMGSVGNGPSHISPPPYPHPQSTYTSTRPPVYGQYPTPPSSLLPSPSVSSSASASASLLHTIPTPQSTMNPHPHGVSLNPQPFPSIHHQQQQQQSDTNLHTNRQPHPPRPPHLPPSSSSSTPQQQPQQRKTHGCPPYPTPPIAAPPSFTHNQTPLQPTSQAPPRQPLKSSASSSQINFHRPDTSSSSQQSTRPSYTPVAPLLPSILTKPSIIRQSSHMSSQSAHNLPHHYNTNTNTNTNTGANSSNTNITIPPHTISTPHAHLSSLPPSPSSSSTSALNLPTPTLLTKPTMRLASSSTSSSGSGTQQSRPFAPISGSNQQQSTQHPPTESLFLYRTATNQPSSSPIFPSPHQSPLQSQSQPQPQSQSQKPPFPPTSLKPLLIDQQHQSQSQSQTQPPSHHPHQQLPPKAPNEVKRVPHHPYVYPPPLQLHEYSLVLSPTPTLPTRLPSSIKSLSTPTQLPGDLSISPRLMFLHNQLCLVLTMTNTDITKYYHCHELELTFTDLDIIRSYMLSHHLSLFNIDTNYSYAPPLITLKPLFIPLPCTLGPCASTMLVYTLDVTIDHQQQQDRVLLLREPIKTSMLNHSSSSSLPQLSRQSNYTRDKQLLHDQSNANVLLLNSMRNDESSLLTDPTPGGSQYTLPRQLPSSTSTSTTMEKSDKRSFFFSNNTTTTLPPSMLATSGGDARRLSNDQYQQSPSSPNDPGLQPSGGGLSKGGGNILRQSSSSISHPSSSSHIGVGYQEPTHPLYGLRYGLAAIDDPNQYSGSSAFPLSKDFFNLNIHHTLFFDVTPSPLTCSHPSQILDFSNRRVKFSQYSTIIPLQTSALVSIVDNFTRTRLQNSPKHLMYSTFNPHTYTLTPLGCTTPNQGKRQSHEQQHHNTTARSNPSRKRNNCISVIRPPTNRSSNRPKPPMVEQSSSVTTTANPSCNITTSIRMYSFTVYNNSPLDMDVKIYCRPQLPYVGHQPSILPSRTLHMGKAHHPPYHAIGQNPTPSSTSWHGSIYNKNPLDFLSNFFLHHQNQHYREFQSQQQSHYSHQHLIKDLLLLYGSQSLPQSVTDKFNHLSKHLPHLGPLIDTYRPHLYPFNHHADMNQYHVYHALFRSAFTFSPGFHHTHYQHHQLNSGRMISKCYSEIMMQMFHRDYSRLTSLWKVMISLLHHVYINPREPFKIGDKLIDDDDDDDDDDDSEDYVDDDDDDDDDDGYSGEDDSDGDDERYNNYDDDDEYHQNHHRNYQNQRSQSRFHVFGDNDEEYDYYDDDVYTTKTTLHPTTSSQKQTKQKAKHGDYRSFSSDSPFVDISFSHKDQKTHTNNHKKKKRGDNDRDREHSSSCHDMDSFLAESTTTRSGRSGRPKKWGDSKTGSTTRSSSSRPTNHNPNGSTRTPPGIISRIYDTRRRGGYDGASFNPYSRYFPSRTKTSQRSSVTGTGTGIGNSRHKQSINDVVLGLTYKLNQSMTRDGGHQQSYQQIPTSMMDIALSQLPIALSMDPVESLFAHQLLTRLHGRSTFGGTGYMTQHTNTSSAAGSIGDGVDIDSRLTTNQVNLPYNDIVNMITSKILNDQYDYDRLFFALHYTSDRPSSHLESILYHALTMPSLFQQSNPLTRYNLSTNISSMAHLLYYIHYLTQSDDALQTRFNTDAEVRMNLISSAWHQQYNTPVSQPGVVPIGHGDVSSDTPRISHLASTLFNTTHFGTPPSPFLLCVNCNPNITTNTPFEWTQSRSCQVCSTHYLQHHTELYGASLQLLPFPHPPIETVLPQQVGLHRAGAKEVTIHQVGPMSTPIKLHQTRASGSGGVPNTGNDHNDTSLDEIFPEYHLFNTVRTMIGSHIQSHEDGTHHTHRHSRHSSSYDQQTKGGESIPIIHTKKNHQKYYSQPQTQPHQQSSSSSSSSQAPSGGDSGRHSHQSQQHYQTGRISGGSTPSTSGIPSQQKTGQKKPPMRSAPPRIRQFSYHNHVYDTYPTLLSLVEITSEITLTLVFIYHQFVLQHQSSLALLISLSKALSLPTQPLPSQSFRLLGPSHSYKQGNGIPSHQHSTSSALPQSRSITVYPCDEIQYLASPISTRNSSTLDTFSLISMITSSPITTPNLHTSVQSMAAGTSRHSAQSITQHNAPANTSSAWSASSTMGSTLSKQQPVNTSGTVKPSPVPTTAAPAVLSSASSFSSRFSPSILNATPPPQQRQHRIPHDNLIFGIPILHWCNLCVVLFVHSISSTSTRKQRRNVRKQHLYQQHTLRNPRHTPRRTHHHHHHHNPLYAPLSDDSCGCLLILSQLHFLLTRDVIDDNTIIMIKYIVDMLSPPKPPRAQQRQHPSTTNSNNTTLGSGTTNNPMPQPKCTPGHQKQNASWASSTSAPCQYSKNKISRSIRQPAKPMVSLSSILSDREMTKNDATHQTEAPDSNSNIESNTKQYHQPPPIEKKSPPMGHPPSSMKYDTNNVVYNASQQQQQQQKQQSKPFDRTSNPPTGIKKQSPQPVELPPWMKFINDRANGHRSTTPQQTHGLTPRQEQQQQHLSPSHTGATTSCSSSMIPLTPHLNISLQPFSKQEFTIPCLVTTQCYCKNDDQDQNIHDHHHHSQASSQYGKQPNTSYPSNHHRDNGVNTRYQLLGNNTDHRYSKPKCCSFAPIHLFALMHTRKPADVTNPSGYHSSESRDDEGVHIKNNHGTPALSPNPAYNQQMLLLPDGTNPLLEITQILTRYRQYKTLLTSASATMASQRTSSRRPSSQRKSIQRRVTLDLFSLIKLKRFTTTIPNRLNRGSTQSQPSCGYQSAMMFATLE